MLKESETLASYPPTVAPGMSTSTSASSIAELGLESNDTSVDGHANESDALSPPDQGYAWVFLAAAFAIEMLAYGFAYSIGVLHEYWTAVLFPQPSAAGTITVATTLCSGLMFICSVLVGPLFTRYPEYRAFFQYGGLAVSVAGIVGAAFATKPWHLIITVGIFYPLGGCTYYLPAATLLFTWWQKRRGLAGGVMYSGTGLGGTVFPFIMQGLLDHFSYKAAMVSLGLAYGLLGALAIRFIKSRYPILRKNKHTTDHSAFRAQRKIPLTFARRNTFYAFTVATLIASFGHFLPGIYMPSYAAELGLSTSSGTLLVAMMNAASVAGLLVLGYCSDRWPTRLVILFSCLGASLSCFLLWGFATNLSVLIIFSLVFGFTALGYAAIWNKMITIISQDDPRLPPILFAIFCASMGVGNVLSGPISSALLSSGGLEGGKYGYGVGDYGGIVLWTGSVLALSAVAGVSYKA